MKYLFDSNTLIEAKNRYYSRQFVRLIGNGCSKKPVQ